MILRWFLSKKVRQAVDMCRQVRRIIHAQRDLLRPEEIQEISKAARELRDAIAAGEKLDGIEKWMKNLEYRKAHEALAPEFELARAVMAARVTAGLTQEQLARRMDTTQSVIARLESGRTRPSTQTLERLASATGTRLKISFEPAGARG